MNKNLQGIEALAVATRSIWASHPVWWETEEKLEEENTLFIAMRLSYLSSNTSSAAAVITFYKLKFFHVFYCLRSLYIFTHPLSLLQLLPDPYPFPFSLNSASLPGSPSRPVFAAQIFMECDSPWECGRAAGCRNYSRESPHTGPSWVC